MTLLEALKAVHTKMQDQKNWSRFGICDVIDSVHQMDYSNLREEFQEFAKGWSKHSGANCYPIPGSFWQSIESNDDEDQNRQYSWDRENSPYAALRWELLEWMIEQLEKEQCTAGQNS